jgi:hypothetical protein
MHDLSLLRPYQTLCAGIPVELEVVLLRQLFRDRQLDLEPVRAPAGAEALALLCGLEGVARGVFEGRAREVRWGVDAEVDVWRVGGSAFVELAVVSAALV